MLDQLMVFIRNEKNLAEEFLEDLKEDEVIILCGGGGMHCIGIVNFLSGKR